LKPETHGGGDIQLGEREGKEGLGEGRRCGISGPGERGGVEESQRSGVGGHGHSGQEDAELEDQEEMECSKRRRRPCVRGGAVEGEREERGKVTLTHALASHHFVMQQLITHD